MPIKNRIATSVLLVFTVLFASAYLTLRLAVLPVFVDLERQQLATELGQVRSAIGDELSELRNLVVDWASWDDSYAFILDRNPAYVRSNLTDNTFTNSSLDLIQFHDLRGELVWGQVAPNNVGRTLEFTAAALPGLIDGAQFQNDAQPAYRQGLLQTTSGIMLVAVAPIRDSEEQQPSRGTLVMGRALDAAELASLRQQSGVQLTLNIRPAGPRQPVAASSEIDYQVRMRADSLRLTQRLADLYGEPSIDLELEMTRTIVALGRDAIDYALGLLLLVGLLLMGAVLLSLQMSVVRPIRQLHQALTHLHRAPEAGLALALPRGGELGQLADAFSEVLRESESGRSELQREIIERRRVEATLRVAAEVSAPDGDHFLSELVAHLVTSLPVSYAFVGKLQGSDVCNVQISAAQGPSGPMEPFIYPVADSPCEEVIKHGERFYPDRLCERFPSDSRLRLRGAQSYAGLLLHNTAGEAMGLLAVLAEEPIVNGEQVLDGLRVFAARAAAELERKQQEARLRKLSRAVEQSPSMVVITDIDGLIEYVNPRFSEITGYAADEVFGQSWTLFRPVNASSSSMPAHGRRTEHRYRRKNGEYFWASESVSAIVDAQGEISHYVMLQEDVTEQRQLADKLAWQATHDALTGLLNRSEFERRLAELIEAGVEHSHALCYLDLDQFKVINDTCGHVAGDELLRQLAALLQVEVGAAPHSVARLGGDEFGIHLADSGEASARDTADRLRATIEEFEFYWGEQRFRVGCCIGVVMIERDGLNLTELLKRADAACFAAKDAGRNRVHVYREDDHELARRQGEMQWVSRITQALDENRLCLYLQPIVATGGDAPGAERYECLLRLLDENGRVVPPGAFLPAAERYGLATRLDRWVLHEALGWLAGLRDAGQSLPCCAINLSGHSLNDSGFLQEIIDQLVASELPADHICFEVTETATIANLAHATVFIKALKSCGCRFALDDFGSGLSSFGYLKELPVDYLKIDGVFIRDILDDPIDEAVVRSINQIGHVLNKQTIAEFVENEQVLDLLRDIGVDFVQGFGVAKPLPLSDYPAYRASLQPTAQAS